MNTEITKEEIAQLPLASFSGKMHIITNQYELSKAVKLLKKENCLGFDTETRPAFRKGQVYKVSLLQLSTDTDAFLFRLNQCAFQPELLEILCDENIVKAGVAIRDDLKALRKLTDFEPANFIELGNLASQLGIKKLGLRSLAAILLNVRISKRYQLTNWEINKLNEAQLRYAATDAWIGLQLLKKLNSIVKD